MLGEVCCGGCGESRATHHSSLFPSMATLNVLAHFCRSHLKKIESSEDIQVAATQSLHPPNSSHYYCSKVHPLDDTSICAVAHTANNERSLITSNALSPYMTSHASGTLSFGEQTRSNPHYHAAAYYGWPKLVYSQNISLDLGLISKYAEAVQSLISPCFPNP
jgi:hypothetical protein